MKKIILASYLLISLGSVNDVLSQSMPDSLFGGWKLIRINGGIAGYGHSNYSHDAIVLTSDCKFRAYLKDSLKSLSNFHLRKSKSVYISTDSVYNIHIEDKFPLWGSFTVSNKKLYIRDNMIDGFTHVYQRIYTKQQIDDHFKNTTY